MLGIVNVVGSSIACEADNVFYTLAGLEISVATTKAYSTQLIVMYMLAVQFAKICGQISDEQYMDILRRCSHFPIRSVVFWKIKSGSSGLHPSR